MKKILMVNPPTGVFIRDDRCQSNVEEFLVSVARPPHELLIMATHLKNRGYQAMIKDYPTEKKSLSDYENDIKEFMPDVFVVNSTIPTLADDLACLRFAKEVNINIITVLRCGAIESIAGDLMQSEPLLDLILYGETDFTLTEFIEFKDKKTVKGIIYREGEDIVKTQRRPFLDDLNQLPFVDRDLINNNLYVRPDTNTPLGLIEVSRGCPYGCIFCLVPVAYGRNHRSRSIKGVIEEIRGCVENYNIIDFHLKSDLFSFDRTWVIEFCNEVIAHNLKIRWFANSRVDTVDEEMLAVMKASGCFALAMGVESGSRKILEIIGKKITPEQAEKAFSICKKHGIKTYGYFIIGFPWDTKDTIRQTIDFSKRIGPDYVDFFFPYSFPGTRLYQIGRELGLVEDFLFDKIGRMSYIGVQSPTLTVNREELIKLRKKALQEFCLRPKYIWQILKAGKGLNEKLRLLRFAFLSLKKIIG